MTFSLVRGGQSALYPRLLSLMIFLIATALTVVSPARAGDDPAAEAFVNEIAQEAIQILSNKDYTAADREAAFRLLFINNSDIPRIANFALGQYARKPNVQQKAEYQELLEDFIVKIYVTRLSEYNDQAFTVLGSRAKGNKGTEVLVQSRIDFTNGREPVATEWWLLKKNGTYRIFDLKVVGIWLAQEQRASFSSVIRNNNDDFNALLDHLRAQIEHAANRKESQHAGDGSISAN